MTVMILITKEDVQTRKRGFHYEIVMQDGLVLNFTPEAVDEFIRDIKAAKKTPPPTPEIKEK